MLGLYPQARARSAHLWVMVSALLIHGGASAASPVARDIVPVTACAPVAPDPQRWALVVGNAQYQSSPKLPNAARDATAVKAVLERCLGFNVILALDQSRPNLLTRVREFSDRIQPGGIALFYYAGHGVEQNGRNYLIPTVHSIRSRADIPVDGYPMDDIVSRMESRVGDGGVNLVVIDACRNNPLPDLPAAGRDFGWRSLAPVDAQSGTLIMHSTRSGAQALDAIPGQSGGNSPFTTALLRQIIRPDLTLRDLPYEVTAEVRQLTARVQEPWASASFVPPLRLAGTGGTPLQANIPQPTSVDPPPTPSIVRAPAPAPSVAQGKMIDLGALPGGVINQALAINDRDEIVGTSSPANSLPRGFVWTEGRGMRPLVSLGGEASYPRGINDAGDIVGAADDARGMTHAFAGTAAGRGRLLLERAQLASLGPGQTRAMRISDLGHVVGFIIPPSRNSDEATIPSRARAFMAEDLGAGRVHRIDTFGGAYSMARDVNDVGQVVGWALNAAAQRRAFRWQSGAGLRDLGTLGGSIAEANAINNRGDIVGRSTNAAGAFRAFLWTERDGMLDLGTLGGAGAVADDVNDRGQVVGTAQDASGNERAFLWTRDTGMTDLGTLGGRGSEANAINEAGHVVGLAADVSGRERAFLWRPSPPSARKPAPRNPRPESTTRSFK
jgi:probable HAF family extracellular repeat protein